MKQGKNINKEERYSRASRPSYSHNSALGSKREMEYTSSKERL